MIVIKYDHITHKSKLIYYKKERKKNSTELYNKSVDK